MFSCQLLGHKSQYSTNMRSCFLKLLLVTQSETAGSRPLGINGVQKLASALMSPTKSKMRSFFGCPYYLMQGSFFIISFRLNPFGYTRFSSKNVAIFSNGMMSVWSYRSVWDAPGMIMSSLLSPFSSLKASSPK